MHLNVSISRYQFETLGWTVLVSIAWVQYVERLYAEHKWLVYEFSIPERQIVKLVYDHYRELKRGVSRLDSR